MSSRSIIISTDLTNASNQAIEVGLNWARKMRVKATLLHLHKKKHLEYISTIFPNFEQKITDLENALDETLKKRLVKQTDKFKFEDVKKDHIVMYSEDIDSFINIAKKTDAELLVIPCVESDFDSLINGKLIERLIRISPIPVLMVKSTQSKRPTKIALPIAFQGFSESSCELAEKVCNIFDCEIVPIHLYHNKKHQKLTYTINDLHEIDQDNKLITNMQTKLEKLKNRGWIRRSMIEATRDSIKDKLLEVIEQEKPDLIIMGSSAQKGFERLYLGGFCEFILRNSSTSILISKHHFENNPTP